MNALVQGAAVVLIVAAAAAYVVWNAVRALKGKRPSCCPPGGAEPAGGSSLPPCASCAGCSGCSMKR